MKSVISARRDEASAAHDIMLGQNRQLEADIAAQVKIVQEGGWPGRSTARGRA